MKSIGGGRAKAETREGNKMDRATMKGDYFMPDNDLLPVISQLKSAVYATGNVSKVIRGSGTDRRTLYRMLSSTGNPRLENIVKLADYLGFEVVLHANRGRAD